MSISMQTAQNRDEAIHVALEALPGLPELSRRWKALEAKSDDGFFHSWTWVSTWLEISEEPRQFFSGQNENGDDVALAILSQDPGDNSWWVNSPAGKVARTVFCEYTDVLSANTGARESTLSALAKVCDKVPLRFCGTELSFDDTEGLTSRRAVERLRREAPFVDLEKVRQQPTGLRGLLSRSKRQQLARAERLEAQAGELHFEIVSADAMGAFLEELIDLQLASFGHRQKKSSFESPWFQEFVKRLPQNSTEKTYVELFVLKAGTEIIGILYNLICDGRVANYQSGFAWREETHAKTGYLTHLMAVDHYAKQGFGTYSFLAGGEQYKLSLATDMEPLYWMTLETPSLRNWAENSLRKLSGRLTS